MKILKSFLEIAKYIMAGFMGVLVFSLLEMKIDVISILSIYLIATSIIVLLAILYRCIGVKKTDAENNSASLDEQTKYDARVIEAAFSLGVKCSIRSDAGGVIKLWATDDPSTESALCSHYYVGDESSEKAVEKAFALEMEAVKKFAARKTADEST